MIKYFEKSKGVIVFYIVVAIVSFTCSIRYKKLQENKVSDNSIVISDTEYKLSN